MSTVVMPLTQVISGTISSTDTSYEAYQSEFCTQHIFSVAVSSPSSLSAGIMRVEYYDPTANAWQVAPQEISILAAGGTAPSAINGNTATATLIVGSLVQNSNGITALTNTLTAIFVCNLRGVKVRLFTDATSGTATLAGRYIGTFI
jgi:hypothetical protein